MMNFMNTALRGVELSGIRRFSEEAKKEPGCMFLTIGEPDFNTPVPIKDAAKKALDDNITHYPPSNGEAFLRRHIAAFEEMHDGIHYDMDEVIVTAGATEALFVALAGILNPGDEVIVPVPAYGLYQPVIELNRGVFVPLQTKYSKFQIIKEELLQCITPKTKALLLTSPNNPTGCLYSKQTLQMIYEIVKKHDIFIICDDVYSRLVFDETYERFAKYTELKDKMIIINSFSKPYAMTGWRIGYLLAHRDVKKQLEKLHQYMVVSTPSIMQSACAAAFDYDIRDMVETYKKRRDYIYNRILELHLEVEKPQGAFYIFPSIQKFGMDSLSFCTRMVKEAKLAAIPGIYFGSDDHIRLSYCYSDEVLKEGMDRFASFLHKLEKEQE